MENSPNNRADAPPANDFSARLKHYRTKCNITQKELAERVGVDISYISKLEKGRKASLSIVNKIAFELGVRIDELVVQRPYKYIDDFRTFWNAISGLLTDAIQLPCFLCSPEGLFVEANPAFRSEFGYEISDLTYHRVTEWIDTHGVPNYGTARARIRARDGKHHHMNITFRKIDVSVNGNTQIMGVIHPN